MAGTGSLAFLGAARYQGKWDAAKNDGTSSVGGTTYSTLLTSNGYHSSTNLTATVGDYWQVATAGSTNINGTSSWSANDWALYSGSAWIRLSYTDTVASIVVGDLSDSVFHIGSAANDKHVIFATGSEHSGSSNFVYDYSNNNLIVSGNIYISDDKKLHFGSGNDSYIEYNEDGDNYLTISGSAAGMVLSGSTVTAVAGLTDTTPGRLELNRHGLQLTGSLYITGTHANSAEIYLRGTEDRGSVIYMYADQGDDAAADLFAITAGTNGRTTLHAHGTDLITLRPGSMTLTGSLHISDDKKAVFGTNNDAHIEYNEDGDDYLVISGSAAGTVISGSKLVLDTTTVASGSLAGPGSYLGVTATGQMVLTASAGGSASGDIEGVTAGNGLTGGGTTGTVTLNIGAGTGIDVGTDDISVDVSDFMANGADNRVVTATGTDAQNAEANLLFDGSALMLTGSLHVSGSAVTITAGEAQSAVLTMKADQGDDAIDSATFTVAESGNLTISASQGLFLSGSSMFVDSPTTFSGDLTVQGGDVIGPESANFRIASDQNLSLELDKDNTGAAYSFYVLNGAGQYVFRVKNTGEVRVVEDQKLGFGTNTDTDCHVVFRDSIDDMMVISGSAAGLVLSGSKLIFDLDTVESGSLAGPGSYLGVTSTGQVVLTASSGGEGDITGVTAGDGLTGGGDTGAVTLTIGGGTGIDVSTNAIAVDVSDFMANGANNRVITATGTDAMTAESNLLFDGAALMLTGSLHVSGSGVTLVAPEASSAVLTMKADQGDDAADTMTITVANGGNTTIAAGNDIILTPGGDVQIADDKKLYFGDNKDASIEYDESGTDELKFAGANIAFEQAVSFDGNVVLGSNSADLITVTGSLSASSGMVIPDDTKLAFGVSHDATIEYDENGTDELRFAGAAVTFEQNASFDSNVTLGETAAYTVSVPANLTASAGIAIPDDTKLRFGSAAGGDVTIEYDEAGSDTLLIEGGDVLLADDKKLYFGSDKDAHIEYRERGDNRLVISGSTSAGVVVSGSTVFASGLDGARTVAYIPDRSVPGVSTVSSGFTYLRPTMVLQATGSTHQLYAGDSGALIMIANGDASSITIKLPDSGTGLPLGSHYTFLNSMTSSAVSIKIVCSDTANELIHGYIKSIDTDSSNALSIFSSNGLSHSSINLNGSTSGSQGSSFTLMNTNIDSWSVIESEFLVGGTPGSPWKND